MRKSKLSLLAAGLGLVLIASACTSSGKSDLMSGIKAREATLNPSAQGIVAQSVTDFSWNLFREATAEDGNVMVSPLSAHIALSMTMNGAAGETLQEMRQALAAGDVSVEELNAGVSSWLQSLASEDAAAKWQVANSVWLRDGYEVKTSFLETLKTFYQADARTMDFASPESVKTINSWVNDKTDGKIDSILEEIKEDVMMYLINAVWFKADWEVPFKAAATAEGSFESPDGSVQTPFLNRLGAMDVVESPLGSGIVLPYTDPRFAFVAVLPKEGTPPRELVDAMDMATLKEMVDSRQSQQVQLALPKFESAFEAELSPMMQALGMKQAFMAETADFSGMSANGSRDLFISAIKHKTYIRVDEKGTEAAAVTSVEMSVTSMPAEGRNMRFDRPFLYAVVDVENGMPLFLGIMENPME